MTVRETRGVVSYVSVHIQNLIFQRTRRECIRSSFAFVYSAYWQSREQLQNFISVLCKKNGPITAKIWPKHKMFLKQTGNKPKTEELNASDTTVSYSLTNISCGNETNQCT